MKGLEKIWRLCVEGGMEGKEVKFTPHWDGTIKISIEDVDLGEVVEEVWVKDVEEMYKMIEGFEI